MGVPRSLSLYPWCRMKGNEQFERGWQTALIKGWSAAIFSFHFFMECLGPLKNSIADRYRCLRLFLGTQGVNRLACQGSKGTAALMYHQGINGVTNNSWNHFTRPPKLGRPSRAATQSQNKERLLLENFSFVQCCFEGLNSFRWQTCAVWKMQ